jgi:ferrous iron transport protein B
MSNFGPGNKLNELENEKIKLEQAQQLTPELNKQIEVQKLEHSYVGYLGKAIEPSIRPLGFDWKIGIAIITSFAAREVFVGTMSTIYGAGGDDDTEGIKEKMMGEKDAEGNLKYSLAVCFSLVIFYVFAMQCISTIATVKRETKGWKWPTIQFVYLTVLAYGSAWVTYLFLK